MSELFRRGHADCAHRGKGGLLSLIQKPKHLQLALNQSALERERTAKACRRRSSPKRSACPFLPVAEHAIDCKQNWRLPKVSLGTGDEVRRSNGSRLIAQKGSRQL